jgi:hypothetical protein
LAGDIVIAHMRIVLLSVATLISLSYLHSAFASAIADRPKAIKPIVLATPKESIQSAQIHVLTNAAFRSVNIDF